MTAFETSLAPLLSDPAFLLRELDKLDSESLVEFLKLAWPVLEPGQPYVHGWHMDAMAEHAEAVARGQITRLLVNVPPGTSKSTLFSVIFPAWLWGPFGRPEARIIGASHEQGLAIRDNRKTRLLIESQWFQERWPVRLVSDQNEKSFMENERRGFRQATAVASMTGRRGDIVIWDDPHSPEKAYSDAGRETAMRVFTETLPTRLNNPDRSAIIVVMQRLHESDVSGHILANDLGYEHLCLPMEFEADRRCVTSIGWRDPREHDGDLLFPARFSRETVERDKKVMGRFAVAGQFQQRPAPRAGGIIDRAWWGLWDHRLALPNFEHIVMSLDTAFTESAKGDYSACAVFGLYRRDKGVGVLLLDAWQERLGLPDLIERVKRELSVRYGGGEQAPILKPVWGPDRLRDAGRGVDTLIIEDKGSGISLRQMLAREGISAMAYNPGRADKLARLHAVSHIFANGMIFAPESADERRRGKPMTWAEDLIEQVCTFSGKGSLSHDDYVDATTQALRYLADYARMSATEEMEDPDDATVDNTKKRGNPYG